MGYEAGQHLNACAIDRAKDNIIAVMVHSVFNDYRHLAFRRYIHAGQTQHLVVWGHILGLIGAFGRPDSDYLLSRMRVLVTLRGGLIIDLNPHVY